MSQQYFWSLVIEPGWVNCAIWTIENDTSHVVATGHGATWETPEDLINAADTSLSSAAVKLPHDASEPSKTVFGVPPSWVSEGQIKKEYLDQIKQVCQKLSLEPTGFVVLPEAISHFIKAEEGSPINGIVIGVGEADLDIAVFKLGNLMGTVNVGRSVSVIEDLVEGLTRFGSSDPLPSRILLYDGKGAELEEVKQTIIKADWGEISEKVKFLHTPAVEIIDPDTKTIAVSLAGASEMANVSKVTFPKQIKASETEEVAPVPASQAESTQVANFFQNIAPADIGFMMDKDVATEEDANLEVPMAASASPAISATPKFIASIKNRIKKLHLPKFNRIKLPLRASIAPPPGPRRLPRRVSLGDPSERAKRPVIIGSIVVGVFLVIGFIAWWILPKAEVIVYISPRLLENKQSVTFDSAATSVDVGGRVLPARERSIDVTGEKTTSATGTKTVGEKAKGQVEIRNGTAVGIKVAAGTLLIGPNDLKFSVDSTASVSAALSPSSPGSQVIAVTADSIGSEYNLAKGESFKVGNYPKSDVDAVVEGDISGGSSRQITAVSASDLKSLETALVEELTDQGKNQFTGELSSDEVFIEQALEIKVTEKNFTNKVGDEASTIKLTASVKLTGVIVAKADLDALINEVLKDQVPSGFVLRPDQVQTNFVSTGGKSGTKWVFDAQLAANLLPEFKPDEVKKQIVGRYPKKAQEVLSSIPGFVRAQIKLIPRLPGKLGTLPHLEKNLSIEVASER